MDVIIRPRLRARSLLVITVLASVPRLVGASSQLAVQVAIETPVPVQGEPARITKATASVGTGSATSSPLTGQQPAERRMATRVAREPSTHGATPDPLDRLEIDGQSRSGATPMLQAAPAARLRLTLTHAQMQAILARYGPNTDSAARGQLDEITVTAPAKLLPMRDTSRWIWGGLGAPMWALVHPTEAWRIVLPIPPK